MFGLLYVLESRSKRSGGGHEGLPLGQLTFGFR